MRVYIEDTDAGGIVYYVNYLKFMERARTEWMRALGFDRESIFSHELMFVVQEAAVNYIQPAMLDDVLQVTASLVKRGGASMVLRQRVLREDAVLAQGTIKIACVDRLSVMPRRMPGPLLERLREYEKTGDSSD
jgi:tol-pal system-associated acyl-CoA thioesterase